MNGYGRYMHVEGGIYIGYWKDDKMHGMGKYTHSDGNEYTGEWKEDQ